jgi:hypothetical protein
MRTLIATALACTAAWLAAGCGEDELRALPPSGTAYRALDGDARLAVAAGCRDRAQAAASGIAADQIAEADPRALRDALDAAFAYFRDQKRSVASMCEEQLPFVTPGLKVRFDRAEPAGDRFTFETDSDIPLTIEGSVAPVPEGATVVVRRAYERARAIRGRVGPDGRFALPAIRLRKIADNTFVVTFRAPPNALRKVHFSAICLDCLAGAPPPGSND